MCGWDQGKYKTLSTTPLTDTSSSSLPNSGTLAQKEIRLTSTSERWKGYGVTICMPEDVPCEVDDEHAAVNPLIEIRMCTLRVQQLQGILGGEYEPVSALYCLKLLEGKLPKKTGVEIQHCVPVHEDHQKTREDIKILHSEGEWDNFKTVTVIVPHSTENHKALLFIGPASKYFASFVVAQRCSFAKEIEYQGQVYVSTAGSIHTTNTLSFVITKGIDACKKV